MVGGEEGRDGGGGGGEGRISTRSMILQLAKRSIYVSLAVFYLQDSAYFDFQFFFFFFFFFKATRFISDTRRIDNLQKRDTYNSIIILRQLTNMITNIHYEYLL